MNILSQIFLSLVSAPSYLKILVYCNQFRPGSHGFQNVTVSSSSPGEVSVTGDFISGSSAIGILSVVYSPDNESNIYYQFIPHSDIPMTIMSNLPDGQYKVSVFVVEENGLPFNKSATTPRNVSLVEGKLHMM